MVVRGSPQRPYGSAPSHPPLLSAFLQVSLYSVDDRMASSRNHVARRTNQIVLYCI